MKQNNRPRVIIITGSIGTGKSTAVNIIMEMGYKVLDSDKIVHDGYKLGRKMHYEVVDYFGDEIINCNGEINRKKLGKIVFSNKSSLEKLNEIVHRFVVKELILGIKKCNEKIIFLDIPLLLEEKDNLEKYGLIYDEIWLVYVNSDIQKERLRKRAISENKNPEDVLNIIDKQISIEIKKTMVDEVIFNEGTIEELRKQIEELLSKGQIS
ncbi:dephospho-CoA kinase [Sedimentibacter acidaminivorans]|uniref:Dephospho-CoA kinase n=1 Tax=Sedimentibacter acidaminivorans TaxID=913099 RepID=A0ABS4GEJ9_9FIRM|nr:dephospho-CoA kinase [Sedimentibacter acidaminivorans]MBP1926122.1 dephospho-CoA kinase [Sedimentibacter acidaminivorans]